MFKKTIVDIFIDGVRKGWTLGTQNLLPNVLMAFVLIEVLQILGLLTLIGKVFGPVMGLFGLPGEAVTVLLTGWLANGGGVGVAASLYTQGTLTSTHISILLPGLLLMGAQLQYMGRVLAVAGASSRHYPVLFAISVLNACMAMLTMRFLV